MTCTVTQLSLVYGKDGLAADKVILSTGNCGEAEYENGWMYRGQMDTGTQVLYMVYSRERDAWDLDLCIRMNREGT